MHQEAKLFIALKLSPWPGEDPATQNAESWFGGSRPADGEYFKKPKVTFDPLFLRQGAHGFQAVQAVEDLIEEALQLAGHVGGEALGIAVDKGAQGKAAVGNG
jgi:hypothetical protein